MVQRNNRNKLHQRTLIIALNANCYRYISETERFELLWQAQKKALIGDVAKQMVDLEAVPRRMYKTSKWYWEQSNRKDGFWCIISLSNGFDSSIYGIQIVLEWFIDGRSHFDPNSESVVASGELYNEVLLFPYSFVSWAIICGCEWQRRDCGLCSR